VIRDTDFEVHNPTLTGNDAASSRRIVLRVTDLPDGADGPFLEADEDTVVGSGGNVFSGGKPLRGARAAEIFFQKLPRKAEMRIGVAVEDRKAIVTYDTQGRRTAHSPIPAAPRWDLRVHDVADGAEGAQITVLMPKADRNWEFDVVAIDLTGKERSQRMGSGSATPGGSGSVWTYSFIKLPLKQVKEFRILARPVYWVEFRDLAMNPASPVAAAKPLRFAPDVQQAFTRAIDLDLASDPENPESASAKSGEHPDLVLEKGKLQNVGTTFALVRNEDWEAFSPQQATDAVYQGMFLPQALAPAGEDGSQRTFCYLTSNGGFGMLQFVDSKITGTAVNLRIKRVLR